MSTNPYQEAYELIAEQTEVSAKLNILTARNNELTAKIESLIASAQGEKIIDGYRLVSQRKTRETRTVIIDKIKTLSPEILFKSGKYVMPAVDIEWTEEQREKYLQNYDYDKHYQIGLTELDTVVGGKKNSAPYVDIDIKETILNTVEKIDE